MRQSPRGERETLPTLGPSGMQLRLNCCWKKRRVNTVSHLRMVSSSYSPAKAILARRRIFSGAARRRSMW